MKTKTKYLLIISGVFFAVSIGLLNHRNQEIEIKNGCIESFNKFAYTPPVEDEERGLGIDFLPDAPWNIESVLPVFPKTGNAELTIKATRSVSDYTEIWVGNLPNRDLYFDSYSSEYKFLVYRTDTKEWRTIPAQIEQSNVYISNLYILKDGSIWGSNVSELSSEPLIYTSLPILSRYNEELKKFEFIESTMGLPAGQENNGGIPFWSETILDKDNLFWIIPRKDFIYTYNPITQEIKQQADISTINTRQAVLSADGNIYISRRLEGGGPSSNPYYEFNEGEILRYSPKTGQITVLENPSERWPSYGNLLTDHSGNLWLGAVGWREVNGVWHKIHPSSFWHFFHINVEGIYRWVDAELLLESSDYRLWYKIAGRGMAWYEPSTGNGCWFTTASTNIAEDQNQILWTIIDGKLYKLPSYTQ